MDKEGNLIKWTSPARLSCSAKFDIFAKDIILIPINHNNAHWTAAAINFRRKRMESYDSMNLERRMVFKVSVNTPLTRALAYIHFPETARLP